MCFPFCLGLVLLNAFTRSYSAGVALCSFLWRQINDSIAFLPKELYQTAPLGNLLIFSLLLPPIYREWRYKVRNWSISKESGCIWACNGAFLLTLPSTFPNFIRRYSALTAVSLAFPFSVNPSIFSHFLLFLVLICGLTGAILHPVEVLISAVLGGGLYSHSCSLRSQEEERHGTPCWPLWQFSGKPTFVPPCPFQHLCRY